MLILSLPAEAKLVSSALIENSTEILIAGEVNNFTLVLSCDECEVELLKEVKTLYRSTEITSLESGKIIESNRETRDNSLTSVESLTRGSEIAKEVEEDNCGCVYRDERGREIPLKKNKEVMPKVIRDEGDRSYDETEEKIQLKEGILQIGKYVGVLLLSFEKDWVEESEAEKETYGS